MDNVRFVIKSNVKNYISVKILCKYILTIHSLRPCLISFRGVLYKPLEFPFHYTGMIYWK